MPRNHWENLKPPSYPDTTPESLTHVSELDPGDLGFRKILNSLRDSDLRSGLGPTSE